MIAALAFDSLAPKRGGRRVTERTSVTEQMFRLLEESKGIGIDAETVALQPATRTRLRLRTDHAVGKPGPTRSRRAALRYGKENRSKRRVVRLPNRY